MWGHSRLVRGGATRLPATSRAATTLLPLAQLKQLPVHELGTCPVPKVCTHAHRDVAGSHGLHILFDDVVSSVAVGRLADIPAAQAHLQS